MTSDRISFLSAGAVPPRVKARRDEMLAAYDAACERAARDGNPIDIAEARRLGRALDNPIVQVARTASELGK